MDALHQLAILREKGGTITSLSRHVISLSNGLPYYFVELTSMDGTQYGIQAYGDEATELYSETMRSIGYPDDKPVAISPPLIPRR